MFLPWTVLSASFGSCTSETMCFTRVQVEKSFWGAGFLCMKTIDPQDAWKKCHMISAFQDVATGNYVWMLMFHWITINAQVHQKKRETWKEQFSTFMIICARVFQIKKKQLCPAGKFPSTKYAKFGPFREAGLVRNPTEPRRWNPTEKTHHRILAAKMRVSNLNTALRSPGTFWKERYVTSLGVLSPGMSWAKSFTWLSSENPSGWLKFLVVSLKDFLQHKSPGTYSSQGRGPRHSAFRFL